jgi:uncharacterized membrane protein YoaK (UPF0700 family)
VCELIAANEETARFESARPSSGGGPMSSRTTVLFLLSATAGSTDAIAFLGLGVFTAHITGNIVVLVAHLAANGRAGIAQMISVPVFMTVVAIARLLAITLDRHRNGMAARALLLIQFAFLLGFLLLSFPLGRSFDPNSSLAVLAVMCGVAAMAVQNVMVQTSMSGASATAVLTTNVARLAIAGVDVVAGPLADRRTAREKIASTFPQILGFVVGCAAGGFLEWQLGLLALLFPVFLSLAATWVDWRVDR